MLLAIDRGDMAMVVTLLNEGFDVNSNLGGTHGGATALDVAELWDQPAIAALLRRHGGRRAVPDAPLTEVPVEMRQAIRQVVGAWIRRPRRK